MKKLTCKFLLQVLLIASGLLIFSIICSACVPVRLTPTNIILTPSLITPKTTETQIFLSTPVINPDSTLSANESKTLMLDLLKNNGNCQLPCLWGITPGKTDLNDFHTWVTRFGNSSTSPDILISTDIFDNMGGFGLIFTKNDLGISLDFSYYETENKLGQLTLTGHAIHETGSGPNSQIDDVFGDSHFNQLFEYYMLPHILSEYGRPSKVLIASFDYLVNSPSPQEWYPFSLVLYYEEKGILVQYILPRELIGDNFVGCPYKAQINVAVGESGGEVSINDLAARLSGYGINELNIDYFKSIEDATSMTTIDKFYQIFKEPENKACVETPVKLWPKQ